MRASMPRRDCRDLACLAAELKAQTDTESLEGAFLALTGTTLRDESASSTEQGREIVQMLASSR